MYVFRENEEVHGIIKFIVLWWWVWFSGLGFTDYVVKNSNSHCFNIYKIFDFPYVKAVAGQQGEYTDIVAMETNSGLH